MNFPSHFWFLSLFVFLMATGGGLPLNAQAPAKTAPQAEASHSAEKKTLSKRERLGDPRPRPPQQWARFQWPEKRKVLFGLYQPTTEELALIDQAVPSKPVVVPQRPRKLLVFYRCQYPHASIATANAAFERLAKTSAFEVTLTDDPQDIHAENLQNYDALLLNNTTDWDITIGSDGRQAVLQYVRGGGGLIGVHAAADSCKGWREGSQMLGGVFRGHPWLPTGTWGFRTEAPSHAVNQVFETDRFQVRDEVYIYRPGTHRPESTRLLISLDMTWADNLSSPHIRKGLEHLATPDETHPVAWVHRWGKGRVFYTNLGHNNTTYWNPLILSHYLAGIQFALGDLEAESIQASPTTASSP